MSASDYEKTAKNIWRNGKKLENTGKSKKIRTMLEERKKGK